MLKLKTKSNKYIQFFGITNLIMLNRAYLCSFFVVTMLFFVSFSISKASHKTDSLKWAIRQANGPLERGLNLLKLTSQFKMEGKPDSALQTTREAQKVFAVLKNDSLQLQAILLECQLYSYTGEVAKFRELLETRLLPHYSLLSPKTDQAVVFNLAARMYQLVGQRPEALKVYLKAIELARKNSDIEPLSNLFFVLAKWNLLAKKYTEALQFNDSAYHYFRKMLNRHRMLENLSQRAEILQAQGKYQLALETNITWNKLKDSIYNEKNNALVREWESSQNLKDKEAQNQKLSAKLESEKWRNYLYISFALLGWVSALAIYLVRRSGIKVLKEKQLSTETKLKQHELEQQNEKLELEALARLKQLETEKSRHLELELKNEKLNSEILAREMMLEAQKQKQTELELENERLQKQQLETERQMQSLKQSQMELEIALKNNSLATLSAASLQKTKWLNMVKSTVTQNGHQADKMRKLINDINENQVLDKDWDNFKLHFENVHPTFFSKLLEISPDLSQTEMKMAAYLAMNFNTKDISRLMNLADKTVRNTRSRLRSKFGLEEGDELMEFLGKV